MYSFYGLTLSSNNPIHTDIEYDRSQLISQKMLFSGMLQILNHEPFEVKGSASCDLFVSCSENHGIVVISL